MLVYFFILLILLCIIKPKSNKCFYMLLFLLWFVASFCTDNADRAIYEYRYLYSTLMANQTEIGFNLLMMIYHQLKLPFETTLCIDYLIIFGIIGWFINKNAQYKGLVLGAYAIFSYCIDAVQIRNSLGFSIALIGINELFQPEISKKGYIKFYLFVLLASFLHFSNIAFLLLVVAQKYDIKKNVFIASVSSGIVFFLGKTNVIRNIGSLMIGSRIDSILGRVNHYTTQQINNLILAMLFSMIIITFCLYLSYRNNYFAKKQGLIQGSENFRILNKIFNSQIMLFIPVFLIPIVPDIYRIQRYGVLLGYIGCSKYIVSGSRKNVISKYAYYTLFYISVLLLFYIQIIKLNNFESTFISLMTNNKYIP